jgi:hypothetical protein
MVSTGGRYSRAHDLAPPDALQAKAAHEPPDSTAGHSNSLTIHLSPDLVGTVNGTVGRPDSLNFWHQDLVTLLTGAASLRITPLGCMATITGWGDLQHLADRLDPIPVAVLIDKRP